MSLSLLLTEKLSRNKVLFLCFLREKKKSLECFTYLSCAVLAHSAFTYITFSPPNNLLGGGGGGEDSRKIHGGEVSLPLNPLGL